MSPDALLADLRHRFADLLGVDYPGASDAEMRRRRAVMRAAMDAEGVDALIVVEAMRAGTATLWLTGWPVTAEAVTVIAPGHAPTLFVEHFNHLPLARRLAHETEVAWAEGRGIEKAAEFISSNRPQGGARARVGVVGRLPVGRVRALATHVDLVDMNAAYTRARLIKSQEELRWLELAAGLTDVAVAAFEEALAPGIDERTLIARTESAYRESGGTNFIHYVASTSMHAPDVAVPRQFPSGRVIRTGDVVSCELSVDFWGWTGQVLRTFFVGEEPTPLYHVLHDVADAAYEAVFARVRPGVPARDLVAASRMIEDAGFTVVDDLVHGYGGGYLPPVLGSASRPAATTPDLVLDAGMALVLQPNVVTRDGRAGVQTGGLVVVTETGARSLQRYPKGRRIVGT